MSGRSILCVTTTKPSAVLTAGAGGVGGGCITLVDPRTGTIGSSLRAAGDMSGKVPIGASSLSIFPSPFNNNSQSNSSNINNKRNNSTTLALGYGYTEKSKEDSYAMFLSIRSSPAVPPILHWKGRLPEGNMSGGLKVSPCGHYIVGGGNSGNLYVWTTIGGRLIRTAKAHYRAILVMEWTECGRFLATGGSDGMVHVFSLMDLVAYQDETKTTSSNTSMLQPIRTWPNHHLPVNDIVALPGGRLASAGQDGQILILELSSEAVLATLQLPLGIQSLVSGGPFQSILYAGSVEGTIYIVSLDEYAVHQMNQQGVVIANSTNARKSEISTMADQVFGNHTKSGAPQPLPDATQKTTTEAMETTSSSSYPATMESDVYRTELRGHERPITSLCAFALENPGSRQQEQWILCSGDETGTMRIWDLQSKSCTRMVRPWHQASNSEAASTTEHHPITSIQLLILPDEERDQPQDQNSDNTNTNIFGSGNKQSHNNNKTTTVTSLITPLQKFVEPIGRVVQIPFLSPSFPKNNPAFWDVANDPTRDALVKQRLKRGRPGGNDATGSSSLKQSRRDDTNLNNSEGTEMNEASLERNDTVCAANKRIQTLEQQLAEAEEKIKRWQAVNNKLMARLQGTNL